MLTAQGIIPGIKVDKGAKPLAGFDGEKITEGLDGLRDRLAEYYELGARFTKWRAVITIGDGIPTAGCIDANAEALARFAALSQEAGLVPIVEPEVLMDGDHTIERCFEVTAETQASRVRCAAPAPGPLRRHAAQAEHGRVGHTLPRAGRRARRSPRPRSAACATTCPPRCPASCSSPAARAMSWPPPISTR